MNIEYNIYSEESEESDYSEISDYSEENEEVEIDVTNNNESDEEKTIENTLCTNKCAYNIGIDHLRIIDEDIIDYNDLIIDNNNTNFIKHILTCSICNNLMYPPVTLNCGHSFCEGCLNEYISVCNKNYYEKKCPLCREYITTKLNRNVSMCNIIDNLECKCTNDNCDWEGKLEFIKNHIRNHHSENTTIICKWCELPMEYKYFKNHVVSDCLFRGIKCKYCGENNIPHINLQIHYDNICPMYLKKCKKCGIYVTNKNRFNHDENECTMRLVNCEYCESEYIFKDLQNHYKECNYYLIKCKECDICIAKCKMNEHVKKNHIDPKMKIILDKHKIDQQKFMKKINSSNKYNFKFKKQNIKNR